MRFLVALYRYAVAIVALAYIHQCWINGLGWAWIPLEFQAVCLMAIIMIWAASATLLKGLQPPAWLKGFTTLYVLIGALTVWFFQGSVNMFGGLRVWSLPLGLVVGVILPVAGFLDFLFFDSHKRFVWHYTLSWMAYLPVYLSFVLICATIWPTSNVGMIAGVDSSNAGSPYPYNGINPIAVGWEQFVVNAAQYIVICFSLGLVLFLLDRIMPKRAVVSM